MIISNNDIIFFEDSIIKLIRTFEKYKNLGAVGPQQQFPNGDWQYSYGYNPSIKFAIYKFLFIDLIINKINKILFKKNIRNKNKKVDYIDGAVILTKTKIFNEINGFCEDFFFYSEEADFCKRLQNKKYLTLFEPKSNVIHYRGAANSGKLNLASISQLVKSKLIFINKHNNPISKYIYIASEIYQNFIIYILMSITNNLFKKQELNDKKTIFKVYFEQWLKIVLNKY